MAQPVFSQQLVDLSRLTLPHQQPAGLPGKLNPGYSMELGLGIQLFPSHVLLTGLIFRTCVYYANQRLVYS